MAKRAKSAGDLEEIAIDALSGIREAAIREARQYLAERLAAMSNGTVKGHDELASCHTDPDFEPTAEFLAGMQFAAELIADEKFDF